MKLGGVFIILFIFVCASWAAYNPHAGLANDYILSATLTTSSNSAINGDINKIRDNNLDTVWLSSTDTLLPETWRTRAYLNILLGNCAVAGRCSGVSNTNYITDGDRNSEVVVPAGTTLTITLPSPTTLYRLGGIVSAINGDVIINGYASGSTTAVLLGKITSSWSWTNIVVPSSVTFATIKLTSTGTFNLREFAATKEEVYEYIIADLGAAKPIGSIYVKAPTDASAGFSVLVSSTANPYSWKSVLGPISLAWQLDTFSFPETTGRYVMFKMYNHNEWRGMNTYELKLYDKYGIYGAPYPATRANSMTYRNLLGLNGIWGWGYSNNVEGPKLFTPVASHVRNYHNLNWDITKPTDIVNYDVTGTPAQWWLNWDGVYGDWKNSGLSIIDASIQFTNVTFPQNTWPNPYANAYTYGKNFAAHFGPRNKNLIHLAEIGNEPWDYSASFYTQVLEGMAKGMKDGDPTMKVTSGAFQADSPDVPPEGDGISWTAKYAGYRITATALQSMDVLNVHTYSYARVNNVIKGVRPEFPLTSFNGFRNMLRWRDNNAPSNEMWLTEWGWDGSSNCVDSRCVSLVEQAAYGVRGLLIGAREGLDRMTWFFYADGGDGTIVYDYSGLTFKPVNNVFTKKPVFYAFQNFLNVLASYHHVAALREADDAYIYIVSDNTNYKLVAWLNVNGEGSEQTKTFTINGYTLSGTTFVEIGSATTGPATLATTAFSQSGASITMKLRGYPRVANVVVNGAPPTISATQPATVAPTQKPSTLAPTQKPATVPPTQKPSTLAPTQKPSTPAPATPSPTAKPTIAPTANGLTGQYYRGENFETYVASKVDTTVDFSWYGGGPALVAQDNQFSIKWTGFVKPAFTEAYTFNVRTDDGCRLYVNGALVIDRWIGTAVTDFFSTPINLNANHKYSIELQYQELFGQAEVHLKWASASTPSQIIPSSALSTV